MRALKPPPSGCPTSPGRWRIIPQNREGFGPLARVKVPRPGSAANGEGTPTAPGGAYGRRTEGQPVLAPVVQPNGSITALQVGGTEIHPRGSMLADGVRAGTKVWSCERHADELPWARCLPLPI